MFSGAVHQVTGCRDESAPPRQPRSASFLSTGSWFSSRSGSKEKHSPQASSGQSQLCEDPIDEDAPMGENLPAPRNASKSTKTKLTQLSNWSWLFEVPFLEKSQKNTRVQPQTGSKQAKARTLSRGNTPEPEVIDLYPNIFPDYVPRETAVELFERSPKGFNRNYPEYEGHSWDKYKANPGRTYGNQHVGITGMYRVAPPEVMKMYWPHMDWETSFERRQKSHSSPQEQVVDDTVQQKYASKEFGPCDVPGEVVEEQPVEDLVTGDFRRGMTAPPILQDPAYVDMDAADAA